jgi:hypothetical protein
MTTATQPDRARSEARVMRAFYLLAALIGTFAVAGVVVGLATPDRASTFDATLPNPMGGPARTAPGEVSGELQLAGLEVTGTDVEMGDVALGVTYVPGWEVTNPTGHDVSVMVGQPQVLDGCCPGPVYADGQLTQAGQELTVPAGGTLLLQFPLQMHAGMDGPHHLAIPLDAAGEQAALHVTGNFTATASPL